MTRSQRVKQIAKILHSKYKGELDFAVHVAYEILEKMEEVEKVEIKNLVERPKDGA